MNIAHVGGELCVWEEKKLPTVSVTDKYADLKWTTGNPTTKKCNTALQLINNKGNLVISKASVELIHDKASAVMWQTKEQEERWIRQRRRDGQWRERGSHSRSKKKRESSLGESVLRKLWSSLVQRDADHRVRGSCGIKGFVSQSPLTLSRQNQVQVLREVWTWNNSWSEKLTLSCRLCPEWDGACGVTGLSASPYQPPGTELRTAAGLGFCSSRGLSVLTHTQQCGGRNVWSGVVWHKWHVLQVNRRAGG